MWTCRRTSSVISYNSRAWAPPFVNLFLICGTIPSLVQCSKIIFDIQEDNLHTARKKSGKWNIEAEQANKVIYLNRSAVSPFLFFHSAGLQRHLRAQVVTN